MAIALTAGMPGAAVADLLEPSSEKSAWTLSRGPDRVRIEIDAFTADPGATRSALLHAAIGIRERSGDLELAFGLRFDGETQAGGLESSRARIDYTENFLRWRHGETRVTVGTRNLVCGRTDENPPVDRLSRADVSRGPSANARSPPYASSTSPAI